MSVFGSIMSSIFGKSAHAAEPPSPGAAAGSDAAPSASKAAPSASGAAPSASAAAQNGKPPASVDVEAILTDLAKKNKEKLDWRHSIVDLMKLLDLDSGLGARKELAKELNYSGDTNDSAKMNVWLHKQVMIKLAENGGKVPDELRA